MKQILSFFLIFNCCYLSAQTDLKLGDFYYEIESCMSRLERDGMVTSIEINDSTTKIDFVISYYVCHDFDSLNLSMHGDTLILNFQRLEDMLCWCGESSDKYHFSISTEKLPLIPFKYKLTHNDELIMDIFYNDIEFKKIWPVKYFELDGLIYNYSDKYGNKNGTWLIGNNSTIWEFDSIYFYNDNSLISKKEISNSGFEIKDSVMVKYNHGKLDYSNEVKNGIEIIRSGDGLEVTLIDPKIDKKGFDRVYINQTYDKEGNLLTDCIWYINGKRIKETICK